MENTFKKMINFLENIFPYTNRALISDLECLQNILASKVILTLLRV